MQDLIGHGSFVIERARNTYCYTLVHKIESSIGLWLLKMQCAGMIQCNCLDYAKRLDYSFLPLPQS